VIPAAFRNFARDHRANVAMMFGLVAIPLVFTVGMGIDYGAAARLKSKLNAAADSAVLAALAPGMLSLPDSASVTAATNMFNAEVNQGNGGLPRLIFSPTPPGLVVSISHPANTPSTRTVTVNYQAQSQNIFGGILQMQTIAFSGSSTASASAPPNIDFYLLLDTSPSMAVAGTQAGINTMVAATPQQGGGCAFACHQANRGASGYTGDLAGNPTDPALPRRNPMGNLMDNYTLARSLGVQLRADLLESAVTALTNQATAYENNPSFPVTPKYRMSINSFDDNFYNLVPLTSNFVSAWTTQLNLTTKNHMETLLVYDENQGCNSTPIILPGVMTPSPCLGASSVADTNTNYDTAMQGITNLLLNPGPGNGTNQTGDTPRETLFFVTDGTEDELIAGSRHLSPMTGSKDWCTPLKNKGVQIAILYTEYLPLPTNSWYMANMSSWQPQVATTLSNCASTGLFSEVGAGQDITAALAALFSTAMSSAHLTQ